MDEVSLTTQTQVIVQPEKKYFFVGKWVKTLIFAFIAFALVLGNFMVEGLFPAKSHVSEANFAAFDYKNDNSVPNNGLIRFANLTEFPTGGQPAMKVDFSNDKKYIFELTAGKMWADFSYSTAKTNILIGKVVLIPDHAVFDAAFDGTKLQLNVYNGDVYVGFLPDGVALTENVDAYSNIFMNRLLVPRDNQLSVPLSKVSEEIRPLLYSKLVKEFKLASIPSEAKTSDWVKTNFNADNKKLENVKQQFDADILYQGSKVTSGFLSNLFFWSEENLTFMPDKKSTMLLTHLFNYLDDAILYSSQGKKVESDASMKAFNDYYLSLSTEVVQSKEFYAKFDSYLENLNIFGPSDQEYLIMKTLLSRKFSDGRDRYGVVTNFWQDVYKGLDSSDILGEEAVNTYYEYFDKTRVAKDSKLDENFYKNYLAYQNQLFDNLLLKYPLFYKDGYFAIKNVLETDLLGLYSSGQLKDELAQYMVSNKISFMKRLKRFFFDGDLDVKTAKEIYKRLFSEISDLMPRDSSGGLAVVKLFESQLADMDDFWGYLNSPEYQSKSVGATEEDRYNVYLQDRKTIWSFVNVQQDVLGQTSKQASAQTILEVTAEVEKALKSNEFVTSVEVGKFDTVDARYIPVKLVLGGYPVEATFDRDNESLSSVKVYDEIISDRAVKIDGLLKILQQKFADLASTTVQPNSANETIETAAQRFARTYIAQKISAFGFKVTADDVKVLDQATATYRLNAVTFKDIPDMLVSFDVLMTQEMAANVLVNVKGQPHLLDGKYTFQDLAGMMVAETTLSGETAPVTATPATDSGTATDSTFGTAPATDGLQTRGVPR